MGRVYKNPGPVEFTATIRRNVAANNEAAWIEFPYDLKETFGVGNLIPFRATFDGHVTYTGSLAKMGGPHAMILLRKDVRAVLGKNPGDSVHVRVELDEERRMVSLPPDLRRGLAAAGLVEAWKDLAFSHQREYVQWIDESKRPETRLKRIAGAIEKIAKSQKNIW